MKAVAVMTTSDVPCATCCGVRNNVSRGVSKTPPPAPIREPTVDAAVAMANVCPGAMCAIVLVSLAVSGSVGVRDMGEVDDAGCLMQEGPVCGRGRAAWWRGAWSGVVVGGEVARKDEDAMDAAGTNDSRERFIVSRILEDTGEEEGRKNDSTQGA